MKVTNFLTHFNIPINLMIDRYHCPLCQKKSYDMLIKHMSPEDLDALNRMMIHRDPSNLCCPSCNVYFKREGAVELRGHGYRCPSCTYTFCSSCLHRHHPFRPCSMVSTMCCVDMHPSIPSYFFLFNLFPAIFLPIRY